MLGHYPTNPPHAITEVSERLTLGLSERAKLSVQNPLRLSPDMDSHNLPIPDIMVIKRQTYLNHPQPSNTFMLIEVANSSLEYDRTLKLALYAKYKVAEYWIINLGSKQIEIYSQFQ